jgi:hypothetical protein
MNPGDGTSFDKLTTSFGPSIDLGLKMSFDMEAVSFSALGASLRELRMSLDPSITSGLGMSFDPPMNSGFGMSFDGIGLRIPFDGA